MTRWRFTGPDRGTRRRAGRRGEAGAVALAAVALLLVSSFPVPAQTAAAPENRTRFLSLEELARREKLLDIREKLVAERGAWDTVSRDAQQSFQTFGTIPKLKSDDEKVLAYVRLHLHVLESADTLGDSEKRLLELSKLVDAATRTAGNNPSVAAYLKQARTQTESLMSDAIALHRRLQALDVAVKKSARAVPPPPTFTTSSGVTMRLVGSGPRAFYVSDGPVTRKQFARLGLKLQPLSPAAAASVPAADKSFATGLTWHSARAFCKRLSDAEKHVYRLPELFELGVLSSARLAPPVAVWSATQWRSEDLQERTMEDRFGIAMVGVWDPAGKLDKARVFPELSFAVYPRLGFLVVTSQETGQDARWTRLKPRLNE